MYCSIIAVKIRAYWPSDETDRCMAYGSIENSLPPSILELTIDHWAGLRRPWIVDLQPDCVPLWNPC